MQPDCEQCTVTFDSRTLHYVDEIKQKNVKNMYMGKQYDAGKI